MIEIVIVALLVIWSALVVFKKVFPKTSTSFYQKLSQLCAEKGWTKLSAWLKPKVVAGCGGSCGCENSDESTKAKSTVQAVKWK